MLYSESIDLITSSVLKFLNDAAYEKDEIFMNLFLKDGEDTNVVVSLIWFGKLANTLGE